MTTFPSLRAPIFGQEPDPFAAFGEVSDLTDISQTAFGGTVDFNNLLFGNGLPTNSAIVVPRTLDQVQGDAYEQRADFTDGLIAQNRSRLTAVQRIIQQEKRQQKRFTVKEINKFNTEALLQGMRPSDVFDPRPPVIKFLDLVDLPRNTLANIALGKPTLGGVFGGAAVSAVAGAGVVSIGAALSAGTLTGFGIGAVGGPFGAIPGALVGAFMGLGAFLAGAAGAGVIRTMADEGFMEDTMHGTKLGSAQQPTIFVSDVLRALGVQNKVVRAVVGFAGDVLFDPLTYLSGGGNVAKMVVRGSGKQLTTASVSKGVVKLMDKLEDQAFRTGRLDLGPVQRHFDELSMVDELGEKIDPRRLLIGSEIKDVDRGRERLFRWKEAFEDMNEAVRAGTMSRRQFRQQFGSLRSTMQAEVGRFATLADVGLESAVLSRKAEAAGDFLRMFAAKSQVQFTFPFMGLMANRFPVAFKGLSNSVPILRVGQPAQLQAALGKSHAALTSRLREIATRTGKTAQEALHDLVGGPGLKVTTKVRLRPVSGALHAADEAEELLRQGDEAAELLHGPTLDDILQDFQRGDAPDVNGLVDDIVDSVNEGRTSIDEANEAIAGQLDAFDDTLNPRNLIPEVHSHDVIDAATEGGIGRVTYAVTEGTKNAHLKTLAPDLTDEQWTDLIHEIFENHPSVATISLGDDVVVPGLVPIADDGVTILRERFEALVPRSLVGDEAKAFMVRKVDKAIPIPAGLPPRLIEKINQFSREGQIPLGLLSQEERELLEAIGWGVSDSAVQDITRINELQNILRVTEQSNRAQKIADAEAARDLAALKLTGLETDEAAFQAAIDTSLPERLGLGAAAQPLAKMKIDIEEAAAQVFLTEQEYLRALDFSTIEMIEAADNMTGALMTGDALTGYNGLGGRIRNLLTGTHDKNLESLHHDLLREENIKNAITRPLIVARQAVVRRLRALDPAGLGIDPAVASDDLIEQLGGVPGAKAHTLGGYHDTVTQIQDRLQRLIDFVDDPANRGSPIPQELIEAVTVPVPGVTGPYRRGSVTILRRAKDGKPASFALRFEDEIDHLLYEARPGAGGDGLIEQAKAEYARSWLKSTMGWSDSKVNSAHDDLLKSIKRDVDSGKVLGLDQDFVDQIVKRAATNGDTMMEQRVLNAISRILVRLDKGEALEQLATNKLEEQIVNALQKTAGEGVGVPLAEGGQARVHVAEQSIEASKRREFTPVVEFRPVAEDAAEIAAEGQLFPDLPPLTRQSAADLKRLTEMQTNTADELAALQARRIEAQDLSDELIGLDDTIKGGEEAFNTRQAELADQIRTIEEGFIYRQMDTLTRKQLAFRELTRVGLRLRPSLEPVQELRAAVENLTPFMKRNIHDKFDLGFKNLNKRLGGGLNPDDMRTAVMMRMIQHSTERLGKNGLMPGEDILEDLVKAEGIQNILFDPTIDELAEFMLGTFEDFRLIGIRRGLLPVGFDPAWTYLPVNFTEAAQRAATRRGIELGEAFGSFAGTRKVSTRQPFMFSRMTNRLRIIARDAHGKKLFLADGSPQWVVVYKGQLKPSGSGARTGHDVLIQGEHPFEVARQHELKDMLRDPARAGLVKEGDLWDLGLEGGSEFGERWLPEEFMTSPQHLSANKHDFIKKVGLDFSGPIFQTDPLVSFTERTGQHLTALATDTFRQTIGPMTRVLRLEEFNAAPKGRAPGSRRIQGVDYRPLKPNIVNDPNVRFPLEELTNIKDLPKTHIHLFPEDLASEIENFAKTFKGDENLNELVKISDSIVSLWKISVLSLPRWAVMNIIGTLMLGKLAGAALTEFPALWKETWRDVGRVHGMWSKPKGVALLFSKKTITVGGEEMKMRDFMAQLILDRVVNSGRVMQEMLGPIALGSTEAKGLAGIFRSHHPLARTVGWWFRANAYIEDMGRTMAYISLRNQGNTRKEAARQVAKFLYDYGDLSHVEKQFGTRIWPFYRWMRNNAALQIKLTIEKPAYASAFPKLLNTLQEAIEDENSIPAHLRPRWMRDQMMLQVAGSDRSASFANLNTLTPAQELFEYGSALVGAEGLGNLIQYTMSGTNPLVKNLYELAAGRELFTRRDIGPPEKGGSISVQEYLFRQTGALYEIPIRVLPKVFGIGDEERDVSGGLLRFLIGGRLIKQDIESLVKAKQFESGETLTRMRFAIKRAYDRGDMKEVQRLSVEYVAINRQLYELGLVDIVPDELKRVFRREGRSGNPPR